MVVARECSLICILGWLVLASGPVFGFIHSGLLKSDSRMVSNREPREKEIQPPSGHDATANRRVGMGDEADVEDRVDKMRFFIGQNTSYKRSWPIPQLQCKEGCDDFEPAMVECTSVESPDQDSQWRCETDLPRHLKFRKTTINCEGFDSKDDEKVLDGSCGLEVSLTDNGLKPIPDRVHRHYYTVSPRPFKEERRKVKDFVPKLPELIGHGKEGQNHARVEKAARHLGYKTEIYKIHTRENSTDGVITPVYQHL